MTGSTTDDSESGGHQSPAGSSGDSAAAAGEIATQPDAAASASPVSDGSKRRNRNVGLTYCLHLVFILIASLLIFLPGLYNYGIIDPMDGLNAEVAREMVECSSWVTPLFNYKPHYEQPVLIYWMIIAAYRLSDASEYFSRLPAEFFARLPSALCGASSGIAILALVRPLMGARAAFFAALALISTPLFVTAGRVATHDVPLALFMMMGALGLFLRIQGAHWVSLAIAYIGLGLALLLSGPLPVVLVAATILIYLACMSPGENTARHRWWCDKSALLHPLLGLVVMLSIAAPWYIAEGLASKELFFRVFVNSQILGHSLQAGDKTAPFWFYIPVFFTGFFPWSLLNVFSVRRYSSLFKAQAILTRRANLERFSIIWLLLVLTVFFVFSGKMSGYLVTAAPAMAILSGSVLDRIVRFRKTRRLALILLVFVLIVMPLIVVSAPAVCFKLNIDGSSLVMIMGFIFFILCFLIASVISAFLKKGEAAVTALACACAFACGTFVPTALQYHWIQNDRPLFLLLKRVVHDKAQVALLMKDSPAVHFYLRRPIRELKTLPECQAFAEEGRKPHYMLARTGDVEKLQELPPHWKLLERRAYWQLFSIEKSK